jgi:CubicO group peptidase (beta-lactamase class C family)
MTIQKLLLIGAALSTGIVPAGWAQSAPQPSAEHKQVTVDSKIFDGYEGRYEMRPGFILNITREGDHLYAQATGQKRFEIFPEGEKEYFAKAPPIQISFTTGDGGKATEAVVHQGGHDINAKRIPGEPLRPRKSISLDAKVMEKYVGRYQVPPSRIFAVTLEDGHLFTQMTGQGKIEVLPESDHEFFVKDLDAQLTFNRDAQGRVIEVILHQGVDHPFKRIADATAESLHSQLAEIDSMIGADLAKRPVGSVTAGVIAGKELIWSKSYGDADMEKKIAADADTVYRIGSITKMFTALMLEQLVEGGKVHLSDPVEKYFPEIKTVQGRLPDAPPITLIQLATHTSGLGREPDDESYLAGKVADWEKTLIAALPHLRYQFEPGTRFFYSNMGFAVLGAALSRAAGESYVEYVTKHIFAPLGMTHSAFERNSEMLPHLSKGYQVMGPGGAVDSETSQREHETGRGYKVPNGAIYTTVGDLARFTSFLTGQGPETVLKSASLDRFQMQTMVPADIGLTSGYGIGFQVDRRDNYVAFGHGGAVAGYTAMLLINRTKGIGVVVFSNGAANPSSLAERSLDILSK